MSELGRKAVAFDFEGKWESGHRRGQPHPWERSRILQGDYSPIVRDLEPEFATGSKHILSWSRPTGSLDQHGAALPKPSPEPLFWIAITRIVRHRNGTWRVAFDVFDRRVDVRYVRRKPPAMPIGDEGRVDEDQARIQSAYTTNPRAAVERVQAVDDASLKRFGEEAGQAQALRTHHKVGARLQAIEDMPARQRVVELHKLASEQGIDCRDDLKAFERRLKRRLGLAA